MCNKLSHIREPSIEYVVGVTQRHTNEVVAQTRVRSHETKCMRKGPHLLGVALFSPFSIERHLGPRSVIRADLLIRQVALNDCFHETGFHSGPSRWQPAILLRQQNKPVFIKFFVKKCPCLQKQSILVEQLLLNLINVSIRKREKSCP